MDNLKGKASINQSPHLLVLDYLLAFPLKLC